MPYQERKRHKPWLQFGCMQDLICVSLRKLTCALYEPEMWDVQVDGSLYYYITWKMSSLWAKANPEPFFCFPDVLCPDVETFWQSFSCWWNLKNDDFIDLNNETIIYTFRHDFSHKLGLNPCLIIAKYYIYCASRDKDNYKALLAFLKSKLSKEKSKCKSQINYRSAYSLPILANKNKTTQHSHIGVCVSFPFSLCFLLVRLFFPFFLLYTFFLNLFNWWFVSNVWYCH